MFLVHGAILALASTGLLGDLAMHRATDLVAAASATGRPPECMPAKRAQGTSSQVWAQARTPNLRRYCGLIARAHARIDENPKSAGADAKKAEKLLPGRAAALVITGRVAARQERWDDAAKAFAEARQRNPRAVEQPVAMHDLARTLWETSKLNLALSTYRELVPRAALLPDRETRARVLLEAAHIAMIVAAEDGEEASRLLDEALAYLREAARDGHHALERDITLSLVLALDRSGDHQQADAILGELRGGASWVADAELDYVGQIDALLLKGLALEHSNPGQATTHYRQFLASPGGKGPYASAVSKRLGRMSSTKKRRGR